MRWLWYWREVQGFWSSATERAPVRAHRGARLLDAQAPGWAMQLDLVRLNVFSNCLLQQIYGSYTVAGERLQAALGNEPSWFAFVYRHGFTPGCTDGDSLEHAWIAEVLSRRPSAVPARYGDLLSATATTGKGR